MSDYFQIDDRCVVQPPRDGDSGVCVDVEVEASWGLGWHGKHVFFCGTIVVVVVVVARQTCFFLCY